MPNENRNRQQAFQTEEVEYGLPSGEVIDFTMPRAWSNLSEDEINLKIREQLIRQGVVKPPLTANDWMYGTGEVALNMLTFFPAMAGATIYGGLGGLAPGDQGSFVERFEESVKATSEVGTFWQPESETGKIMMNKLDSWMHALQFGDAAGEFVRDTTENNVLAAAAKTFGDGWVYILPLFGMRGKGSALPRAGTELAESYLVRMGEAIRDAEKSTGQRVGKPEPQQPQPGISVTGEVQVPTSVRPSLSRDMGDFHPNKMTIGLVDVITKAGEVIAKENKLPPGHPKVDALLFEQVGELIRSGRYDGVKAVQEVRQKYNLDLDSTAALFEATISFGGKVLNRMSQLRKKLNEIEASDPVTGAAVRAFLERNKKMDAPTSIGERWMENMLDVHDKLTNTWRIYLTSSLKTVVRNVETSSLYMAMDGIERGMTAAINGGYRGFKDRSYKPFVDEMQSLGHMMKALAPKHVKGRDRLFELLEESDTMYAELMFKGRQIAESQPVSTTRLGRAQQFVKNELLQPVNRMAEVYGDVYGGKMTGAVHVMNTAQERAVMKTAFEMQLRHDLALAGKNFDTIHPKNVPTEMYHRAWDYATKMSFSYTPKGPRTQAMIRGFSSVPILAQTFPFPRFVFGNALPFVANHGPWSMLRLMDRNTRAYYLKHPRELIRLTSEATIGTYLLSEGLSAAWNMKEGQKWSEDIMNVGLEHEHTSHIRAALEAGAARAGVEAGEYYVDNTPYSPFAYYRGLAQAFLAPETLAPADFAQIITGLNRVSGTGLGLVEIFNDKGMTSGEKTSQLFQRTLGNFIGGFAMPARTVKDIMAGWDPEEAIYRDVRQNPIIGPFMNNMPWLSQELPPKFSPFYEGPRVNKYARFSQLTGLNLREKTRVEEEMQKLDLPPRSLFASTGDAEYDNSIHLYQGKVMRDLFIDGVLESQKYQQMSPIQKRLLWKNTILPETRKLAVQQMAYFQPKLTASYILNDKITRDVKDQLKEAGVDLDEFVKGFRASGQTERSPASFGGPTYDEWVEMMRADPNAPGQRELQQLQSEFEKQPVSNNRGNVFPSSVRQ